MPKDFKKMYLDEQNARLKQDLVISDLKKEMEHLKNIMINNYSRYEINIVLKRI